MYFELKMAVIRLILQLQKNLWYIFSPKNYFSRGVFYKFLLSDKPFLSYCQKCAFAFAFYPPSCQILANSDSLGGRKFMRLCIFDNNSKKVHLRAKICKTCPYWNNFLVKKYHWGFFVAAKLSKWRPFWVQNTNGRGGLNFRARSFKLWNFP